MECSDNMSRGNRDRISDLPDCLLHLIMSFLTTHDAVRMCVLSKRWKNLWTTLPSLNFELEEFKYLSERYDSESEDGEPYRYCRVFRDFVSMTLLLLQSTDLLKFRLSCSDMDDGLYNTSVSSWIRYALKHNLQVLDIGTQLEVSLPLGLFSCASLVDLSLLCYHRGPSPPVVNLPCIKRLHLRSFLLNEDFMKKLLCGCPVLEYLHLERCYMYCFSMHSNSLKYLNIEDSCGGRCIVMELINTPKLLSFYYTGCAQYIRHNLNMPSLTSAIIHMGTACHLSYNGNSKFLTGISSVESIELSGCLLQEFLVNELPNIPTFQNAKELSVDDLCLKHDFSLLASFIQYFPNLKVLSLQQSRCYCAGKEQESLKITPFKCKQLHTVNVKSVTVIKIFTGY